MVWGSDDVVECGVYDWIFVGMRVGVFVWWVMLVVGWVVY